MPTYLYLPGVANNYASTPDIAAYDGSTSYRFTIGLKLNDYTAGSKSATLLQIGQNFVDSFRLKTDGTLEYVNNGVVRATSSSAVSATDGQIAWFRAAVTTGSGTGTIEFFESIEQSTNVDNITFGSISDHTSLTISGLPHTTVGIHIGVDDGGDDYMLGPSQIYYAEILVDGSVEFLVDFTDQALGATSLTESSSNAATLTIHQSGGDPAAIKGSSSAKALDSYASTRTLKNDELLLANDEILDEVLLRAYG